MNHGLLDLEKYFFFILPHIKYISISNKKEKTNNKCSKKSCKHYSLLFIIYGLACNAIYVSNVFNFNREENPEKSIFLMTTEELSTCQGIEIVLITIFAKLLLKYKYFIHHYLSIIIFFLSSIAFDLLLKNYNSFLRNLNIHYKYVKALQILLYIGKVLAESVYYCYIKFMIDKHYHNYWNITASIGIMVCAINIILIFLSFLGRYSPHDVIDLTWYYSKSVHLGVIISKFIINIVLQFFFLFLKH